jgi:hypothetical protein
MATSGLQFTAIPQPFAPTPVSLGVGGGPQPNATAAQTAQNQDIVTLAGRTAEGQQARTNNGSSQFGEAAAFFFAERQSFHATNGSGGSQTSEPSRVPKLPVKLVEEGGEGDAATNSQTSNSAQSQTSGSTALANVSSGSAGAPIAVSSSTSSGASAAASSASSGNPYESVASTGGTGVSSQAPLAELAQLDSTLQQMGINPQSISLFNRMALLLYANDPAGLRVLVQALQSGAQATTSSGSPASSANGLQNIVAAQAQSATAQPAANAGTTSSEASTDNPASSTTVASRNVALAASSQPSQNYSLAVHIQELQLTFAAVGAQQSSGAGQNQESGQLLNVTA